MAAAGAIILASDVTNLETRATAIESAWVTYTPTLVQSVTVTKTIEFARYKVMGKTVHVQVSLSCTSAGTANFPVIVGLPNSPVGYRALGVGEIFDTSVSTYYAGVANWQAASTCNIRAGGASTAAMGQTGGVFTLALATGDLVMLNLTYEIA